MIANCCLLRCGEDRPVWRVVDLALHPFLARHEGQLAEIVERFNGLGGQTGAGDPFCVPRDLGLGPLEEALELGDLQSLEIVALHRFVTRVPVRRLRHRHTPL